MRQPIQPADMEVLLVIKGRADFAPVSSGVGDCDRSFRLPAGFARAGKWGLLH
jgi:hypothetical protein